MVGALAVMSLVRLTPHQAGKINKLLQFLRRLATGQHIFRQGDTGASLSAQIVIDAFNDSSSETFKISAVRIAPATVSSELVITDFSITDFIATITWNSEIGVDYDLQFTNDLEEGEFGTVATVTATGAAM